MAWDSLFEDEFSVGYADQSDHDVEVAVSGNWMQSGFPQIKVDREMDDTRRASRRVGGSSKRGVGRLSGTVTLPKILMRSQAIAFDASAGNPTAGAPELDLLAEILGATHVGAYSAGGVGSGPAANSIDFGGAAKLGCAYAFGASESAISSIGWVQKLDTSTTYDLFQNLRAIPAPGDNIYPMLTMVPAAVDPTPKTIRLVGQNSAQDIRLIGCMPTQVSLSLDEGGHIYGEYSYTFTDLNPDESAGGLQSYTRYQSIPPLLGDHNARVVIGANLFSAFRDGSADRHGSCDVSSFKVTIALAQSAVRCHGAAQGVARQKARRRTISTEFTVPKVAEFNESGRNVFLRAAEEQTDISVSLEVGTTSGALFGMLVPGAFPVAEPGRSVVEGKYSYTVSMEAGDEYIGDGAETDAGQSVARFAFG